MPDLPNGPGGTSLAPIPGPNLPRPDGARPRVVVVGAGFGGLAAARALRGADAQVVVVDRQNHHLFQPLLYQVATAALAAPDIASPIRSILRRQANAIVLLAEVRSVDPHRRVLELDEGGIAYDHLVIAAGARHSYFGHDAWEARAPGLKTLEDALEIRSRVLLAFEEAERSPHPAARAALLTFVVVGGGPTGVELAGALAEISRYTLARDFRFIDPAESRVHLVEAGPRILSSFDEDLSARSVAYLQELGVTVHTGTAVTGVDAGGVDLGERRIEARTVLWAAGVVASPLGRSLGVPLDRVGRVIVRPDLTVPGHPEVSVVGDLAHFAGADGRPLPGVAPVATQQGRHAARNVRLALAGRPREAFRYVDRGSMATVGRARAVAEIGGLRLAGYVAWLAWALLHIALLAGFRNRVLVMIEWIWAYVTFQRGARLITEAFRPSTPTLPQDSTAPLPPGPPSLPPAPPPAPG